MRIILRAPIVVVALAAGCGGGAEQGLIAPEDASSLLELLDQAEERFEAGRCDEVAGAIRRLDQEIDRLPDTEVDERLRTTLNAEVQELDAMSRRCRPADEETVPAPTTIESVPAPETPPTTTESTPTTTEEKEREREESRGKPEPPEREKPPGSGQPQEPEPPPAPGGPPEPVEPPGQDESGGD